MRRLKRIIELIVLLLRLSLRSIPILCSNSLSSSFFTALVVRVVNITPTGGTAPGGGGGGGARAVWIEYDAAKHRLSVYVAAAGEPRPAAALLDARLGLAGRRTTETAMVGFFASAIQDVLVGVRDWNLTVDRLDTSEGGGRKEGAACWVFVLLAVLGSVAATA